MNNTNVVDFIEKMAFAEGALGTSYYLRKAKKAEEEAEKRKYRRKAVHYRDAAIRREKKIYNFLEKKITKRGKIMPVAMRKKMSRLVAQNPHLGVGLVAPIPGLLVLPAAATAAIEAPLKSYVKKNYPNKLIRIKDLLAEARLAGDKTINYHLRKILRR